MSVLGAVTWPWAAEAAHFSLPDDCDLSRRGVALAPTNHGIDPMV